MRSSNRKILLLPILQTMAKREVKLATRIIRTRAMLSRRAAFPATSMILTAAVVSISLSLANGSYGVADLCNTGIEQKTGKLETISKVLSESSDLFNDAHDIAESAKLVKYEVNCGTDKCVRSCQLDGVADSKSTDRGETCKNKKDIKAQFDYFGGTTRQTMKCTLTCQAAYSATLNCSPKNKKN